MERTEERARGQDLRLAEPSNLQQVMIARDEIIGATGHRAFQEAVVGRIMADDIRALRGVHGNGLQIDGVQKPGGS